MPIDDPVSAFVIQSDAMERSASTFAWMGLPHSPRASGSESGPSASTCEPPASWTPTKRPGRAVTSARVPLPNALQAEGGA